jgi:hypothetical protein
MIMRYGERGEVFAGGMDAQQRGGAREAPNLRPCSVIPNTHGLDGIGKKS